MIKKIIRIAALALIFSAALSFLAIFFIAYFTPEKQAIIDINTLGEANFELGMVIFTLIILPWVLFDYIRLIKFSEKAEQKNEKI